MKTPSVAAFSPSSGAKPVHGSEAGINRSASALTHPAHGARGKAQQVRGHAQKERGFKEHLGSGQQDNEQATHTEPTDELKTPSAGIQPPQSRTDSSVKPPGKPEAPAEDGAQGAVAEQKAIDKDAQLESKSDAGRREDAEPFVTGVVAEVMRAVDPALGPKPDSIARSITSVSGNTAAAMRQAGGDEHAGERGVTVQGSAHDGAPVGGDADDVGASTAGLVPVGGGETDGIAPPPIGGVAPDSGGSPGASPRAAGTEQAAPPRAAATVSTVASALTPAAGVMAPVAGEPKLSLTPTLASVSLAVPSGSGQTSAPSASSSPTSQPLLPPAQQVQQAFEVAMRDLPAPAGERLVTLKMNPVSLGSLRIALHVSGETVQVRFQVGSAKARAAIDESMEDLKASIGRQGLRIASVEVEEDRALAAPGGVSLDEEGEGAAPPTAGVPVGLVGKGFAQLLKTPPGPEGVGADSASVRTTNQAETGDEGGALQVLTFRLDAVG